MLVEPLVAGRPRRCLDPDDPYGYQLSFGNYHGTEAIPGALPRDGRNDPQKHKFGLYAEQLNGTSFISPKITASHVWMYRAKPASVHQRVSQELRGQHNMEASFIRNPDISFTPLGHTWGPLAGPGSKFNIGQGVTFAHGLNTIGGHGDPTFREGLAVHQYAFNQDMVRQAFVNADGQLLLVPHYGALDIQTELGKLLVKPGMIVVIPAGIRFSVNRFRSVLDRTPPAPDAAAAGYALEIFGSHFTVPTLGTLGTNGLAHVRDFEYPVAACDPEPAAEQPWEVTIKCHGKLFSYTQPHTPYDVAAWHGKYAPYRYNLAHFGHLSANADQLDPTAYCVLTAPSKSEQVSLVDFCVFGEKWVVSQGSMRIPCNHRNMAAELCGVIRGRYAGSVRPLEAGGLTFEQSFMPHGESYEAFLKDSEADQVPVRVSRNTLAFMFHVSSLFGLTKWARERHPDIRPERPGVWDSMRNNLVAHIGDVNTALAEAGMPTIEDDLIIPSSPDSLDDVPGQ